jgi:hypothetical protein
MGYPLQKKFSAVLYESQELSWRQVGGLNPSNPSVASPLPENNIDRAKMFNFKTGMSFSVQT